MGYEFQVTIDSGSPHTQAKWWAEALGWRVEPSDEDFIRGLVAAGHAREDDTEVFEGRLVWRVGAAISDPDNPARPRVLFQRVPEGKTVKNRMHLDIRAGDDSEAVVARLEAAGAAVLHRGRQGPFEWITMADPEGNEFCVG
ncbi:MAG: VOC family protein [Rhodococcus sp.]|uniref:VOC family protein n=1 Tax=Rhodococcus TaxID=1827 RepID=UPI0016AE1DF7|nr:MULTISPECIES: VOC family protein [Rhodococcus]NLV81010.1 VOC family protein [Rhodococcus sp. (in: high G+C Gram-positive bacteria)]